VRYRASMPEDISGLVEAVRLHYDDGCFACGRDNPIGLHLDDFTLDDDRVGARFTPRPDYRGAGTTLHGGVAATALDEILVWAGIITEDVLSVTGNITLRYRRPVHVDEAITVSARVHERNGRRLQISGELTVDDQVRVEGSGLYLVVSSVEELLAGHDQPPSNDT
jgi:acyl-coenzyme A thioesterase PaaI-like protein